MRELISIAALVVSISISTASAASEANDIAVRNHMLCVARNVAKVDDGRMSAREIAQLVQPLCHSAHEAAMRASSPESWQNTPPDAARQLELDHTTAAVEWYRSQQQSGH